MNELMRKLKSKAGESLVESLCAILIFTMASIVMFSMVSAANDINAKAKEKDAQNQAHLLAVEKGEETMINGSGTVYFNLEDGTEIAKVKMDVYGGQDGSLFAYFVQLPEPEGG